MFRQMLMAGASRAAFAPENDDGADFDDGPDDLEFDADDEDQDDEPDQDADDDGEPGDDEDQEDEPAPRATRGQNRVATLAAERKAEKERADRLERELAEIRRQQTQGPVENPQQAAARREAHLATLTEAGRLEYLIQEGRQQTQRELDHIRFNSFDASDKAAFQALAARNPAVAGLEKEVEDALAQMRANGTNAPRETVAKYLLGEKALAKVGRARTAGRKREQEGRERHQGRPMNGRGDVPSNGSRRTGNDAAARRKRLENVPL